MAIVEDVRYRSRTASPLNRRLAILRVSLFSRTLQNLTNARHLRFVSIRLDQVVENSDAPDDKRYLFKLFYAEQYDVLDPVATNEYVDLILRGLLSSRRPF